MRFSLAVHRGHVAWWLLTALRPPEQASQVALTFEADLWPLRLVFRKPALSRCCAVYHALPGELLRHRNFLTGPPGLGATMSLPGRKRSGFGSQ
jgi:hypothetical protein